MLGPGLIGGSLIRAVRRRCPEVGVRAWARREEVRRQLEAEDGLVELATDSLTEAVEEADCIVLAMPTGGMAEVVERLPVLSESEPAVVTDVASVKVPVMRDIAPLVRAKGGDFVGSHPMAGSEKAGFAHADASLFEGAPVILTPGEGRSESDGDDASGTLARLHRFWESLGADVTTMGAGDHDRLVASISHLPHLAAAALVRVALGGDSAAAPFCGGGFRDTTRVSSGSEELWADILADNHRAVSDGLAKLIAELDEWKTALDSLDRDRLRGFLSQARRLRETL